MKPTCRELLLDNIDYYQKKLANCHAIMQNAKSFSAGVAAENEAAILNRIITALKDCVN